MRKRRCTLKFPTNVEAEHRGASRMWTESIWEFDACLNKEKDHWNVFQTLSIGWIEHEEKRCMEWLLFSEFLISWAKFHLGKAYVDVVTVVVGRRDEYRRKIGLGGAESLSKPEFAWIL
ncbi:hypothetical protein Tco_1067445 [Tanacetum coccineum]|uniref:Uncharacterized protein n=1 Tax=Tanacetum coccineum TaxID=301880 RepID=A0ABQ5HCV9_9ASTR